MNSRASTLLLVGVLAVATIMLAMPVKAAPTITLGDGKITFSAMRYLVDNTEYVNMTLGTNLGEGWVGVGLGPGMSNADIWILSKNLGVWSVLPYKSTSRSAPSLNLQQGIAFVKATDSGKNITFTRKAKAPTSESNSFDSSAQTFIWAMYSGSYTKLENAMHTSGGTFKYNYDSDTLPHQSGSSRTTGIIIHGSLMSAAWSLLSFVAVFAARFLKKSLGSMWFNIHRFTLLFATVLTLVGFGLIVAVTDVHFDNFHGIFGFVLVILCVLQGVLGVIIDKMFDPARSKVPFRDTLHWVLGYVVVLCCAANVIVGHYYYGTILGLTIFNIVVIALAVLAFIVAQIKIGQQHEQSAQMSQPQ